MRKRSIATVLAAGVTVTSVVAATSAKAELRVGYITTLTGGAAILGKAQLSGWRLGLEHNGWTKDGDMFAGVPMRLFVGDDRRKPEVGLRVARKMLRSSKVHVVAGIIWSNILMTVQKPIFRQRRLLLSTNAGATPLFGKFCSPYFVSSSLVNDEASEAMGQLLNKENIKTVYLMAPNYQAGKDNVAGFRRFYKGTIAGTILFKIGARDFQAEISRVRASKPDAVFIFAPGGMGISFLKQWSASGAGKDIKLYTVYTIDNLSLPAIGKAAVGAFDANFWSPDLDNPRNKKFVRAFRAKYKKEPSFHAAAAYDGAQILAAALRRIGGKVPKDMLTLAKAIRRGPVPSVRGDLAYNGNGALLQPYYQRKVVMNAEGMPTLQSVGIASNKKDSHWPGCPPARRYPKN